MLASLSLSLLLHSPNFWPDNAYTQQQESWRKDLETELTRTQGWLSLVGLSWLKEGENTIGAAKTNSIVLPASTPAKLGTIIFLGGSVTLSTQAGGGEDTVSRTLLPDTTGNPTKTTIGSVSFIVIQRGTRTGLRIWDSKAKALTEFKGRKWFPVDANYRIEADWNPYPTPKTMPITNVLGDTAPVPNPGYVTFKIGGKACRLEAQGAGDALFFNFKDVTSGNSTYPAGRFLDAPGPKDGKVILDFNRATNPPCAFTPFATCPLPPAGNTLAVKILAGEKTHHPHI